MTRKSITAGAYAAAAVLSLAVAPRSLGQTAPAPEPTASAKDGEDLVVLSPFVVSAAEDSGYRATNTLAGTRIRTDLKDVGSAISVVTSEFLRDTNARNNEDLLVYTTNTEVGGLGGNFTANGTGMGYINTDAARLRPQNNTRVRGLTSADNTRDFFLSDIPWDGYIVDRVDMQRGPNSILFGLGSPAGIVNSSLNTASFQDSGKLEFRYGSFGSYRTSVDVNRVLLADELSIRGSFLSDRSYFKQEPAFNYDKRYYGAMRWDPKFLNQGRSRTSIRANYEHGSIKANRPRVTPPVDAITPWFASSGINPLNKLTIDSRYVNIDPSNSTAPSEILTALGTGAIVAGNAATYNPWIDGPMGRIYDGPVAVFADPNSAEQSYWFMGERSTTLWSPNSGKPINGSDWWVARGIQPYNAFAVKANLPGQRYGIYNPDSLTDTSIFDFFNNLIDGPNKREWQKWEAFNLNLSQTFLDNRVGFELAYDYQRYNDGQDNIIGQNNGQIITVDIMRVLPDGTANPNVGRPMITSDSANNNDRKTFRRNARLTAFGEFRASDVLEKTSLAARILGTHRVTGLYNQEVYTQDNRSWMRYAADADFASRSGKSINEASRAVSMIHYLGESLLGASSAAGANLAPISAVHSPRDGSTRLWDSAYTTPGTWENQEHFINSPVTIWNADEGEVDDLYTLGGASKQKDKTKSLAFVWQGFMFDNLVVPTVGWRRDESEAFVSGNPPSLGSGRGDVHSADWRLPTDRADAEADGFGGRRYNKVTGESLSWGVVVHTPKSIKEKMPLGTNLSLFFSKSDNFRPDASRRDLLGNPVDPATGDTKEFGVVINTLNDRLSLKINRYDTKVKNVTLSADELPGFYLIGAGESWGYGYATWARKGVSDYSTNYNRRDRSDPTNGTPGDTSDDYFVSNLPLINGEPWLSYQPSGAESDWTAATIQSTYDAQQAALTAFLDPANRPPENFMLNWGFRDYPDSNWWGHDAGQGGPGQNNWTQATGVVVTGDTRSKGWEFELTAQPTKNWSLTFNASKTDAQRSNLAKSYADWIEGRWAFYQTAAGNVRLWGAGASTETVRSKFQAEVMGGYQLFTQLAAGSQAPEIRPWRFNLVTNYRFAEGSLKGFNVGGGYRWEDKNIIGYPFDPATSLFDVGSPIKGKSDDSIDLWVGYERNLTEKIKWRIQLNVRNAFESASLVPITVNPVVEGAGTTADPRRITGYRAASYRIKDGMTWNLTNTFSF